MTIYLSIGDVERQVRRFGFVIRDDGLLRSAVGRPETTAFGVDAYPDLFDKAAALCQSIDHNQPLLDGNKRLAWSATKVFLRINGWRLRASPDEGEQFMLEIVAGGGEIDVIAGWLRDHASDGVNLIAGR